MSIWAIVPVKPLRRGKSRLAGVLGRAERAALSRSMLERTIQVLRDIEDVDQVLVVSRDPDALVISRSLGARTVQEVGAPALNAALRRANAMAVASAARAVLIIPADLPLLRTSDVSALIARAADPPVVVIAPDRRREGTNALLLSPAGIIAYDFGGASFPRHCDAAARAGARLEVVESPGLRLDLDMPDDLELMRRLQRGQA